MRGKQKAGAIAGKTENGRSVSTLINKGNEE